MAITPATTVVGTGSASWDGRTRFGRGVAGGTVTRKRVTLTGEPLKLEHVGSVGLNYGNYWLESVGNDVAPIAAVPVTAGVVLVAGLSEGPENVACVRTDGTYEWVIAKLLLDRPYGFAAAGKVTTTAGERVVILGAQGTLSLIDAATGAITGDSLQASKAHPVGFGTGYNRQNISLGCGGTTIAVAYLDYDLVRVWTANADGATLTWVSDTTISSPAGVAVNPTTGDVAVIAGVTTDPTPMATVYTAILGTLTGGTVIDMATEDALPLTTHANAWRVAVKSDGTVAVASWGPDHRIRVYSAAGSLLATLGADGGRTDGEYVGTSFKNIHSLDWDGGSLWVTEFKTAARVTRKINATTGAVERTLIGGQSYEASCCPEGGDDPTKVWVHSRYGLTRHTLDTATGVSAIDREYTYRSADLAKQCGLRSVRVSGRTYVFDGVSEPRLYLYDSAAKTLRLTNVFGRLDVSAWLPSGVLTAAAAANPGHAYYVWTAPDGGSGFDPVPMAADIAGWSASSGALTGLDVSTVGPDLAVYFSTRLQCKIPLASIRGDGVPAYHLAGRVDYQDIAVGDCPDVSDESSILAAGDGYLYQTCRNGYGSPNLYGGAMGWGEYYHGSLGGVGQLFKRNSDGTVVWCGASLKESMWNPANGRVGRLMQVCGVALGVVFVGYSADSLGANGLAAFDVSTGLFLFDLYSLPVEGGFYPYHGAIRGAVTEYGSATVCVDPADAGAVLLFLSGNSSGNAWRVRGLNRLTRTTDTVTIAGTVDPPDDGTGLAQAWHNTTDTTGVVALSRTGNYLRLDDGGTALPGVSADPCSVVMTGRFNPVRSEPHRFTVYPAADGTHCKLWVGGTLVVDTANGLGRAAHAGQFHGGRSAPVDLVALTPVAIRVEVTGLKRSGFIHGVESTTRVFGLTAITPTTDQRDIPLTQLYPSGSATALAGSAYDAWTFTGPDTWSWPCTRTVAGTTPGATDDTPPLYLIGDARVTAGEMVLTSTYANPAALWCRTPPWTPDYDPFNAGLIAWSFGFDLKTSSTGGAGRVGPVRIADPDSMAWQTYSLFPLAVGASTVAVDTPYDSLNLSAAVGIADGSWHSVLFEVDGYDVTLTIDGVEVATDQWDGIRPPPSGLFLAPPVPATGSATAQVWRVRNVTFAR